MPLKQLFHSTEKDCNTAVKCFICFKCSRIVYCLVIYSFDGDETRAACFIAREASRSTEDLIGSYFWGIANLRDRLC